MLTDTPTSTAPAATPTRNPDRSGPASEASSPSSTSSTSPSRVGDQVAASANALGDLVVRNPVPSALAAAAIGAGLMALATMLARSDAPDPRAPIPLQRTGALDYGALREQVADLADRVSRLLPSADAAKDRLETAGDAVADTWGQLRGQALDLLGRLQPQASAAVRVARENPVWTALAVGVIGALVGSQMLGPRSSGATNDHAPQSDPGADA